MVLSYNRNGGRDMKNPQIVFTKVNTAEWKEAQDREPGDSEVRVKTAVSTISCGTERANITGNANVSPYAEEGTPVVFPRYSGYSSAGIVVGVGKQVSSVRVGDRVAMYWSQHKLYNVLPENNVVKIDDGVTYEEAALCHIGNFPLAALRKTRLEIGESVLVMGAGTLGLLAVVLARAAGAAPILVADPDEHRREKALSLGADDALDPTEAGFAQRVKDLTGGGVAVAIEVTGLGAGLEECLDGMARFGRVALLGCTRDKNFTIDYYRKVHAPGISLIGSHTLARPEYESHPGYFTNRDDIRAQLRLLAGKRIRYRDLVDETHAPTECAGVYDRLVHDRDFPPFVQFDWRCLWE